MSNQSKNEFIKELTGVGLSNPEDLWRSYKSAKKESKVFDGWIDKVTLESMEFEFCHQTKPTKEERRK